jgi:hypothetical protein
MLVSLLVALVCTLVAVLGISAQCGSGLVGLALAFATVGAVALLAGLIVFPSYVETHVDRRRIELRSVAAPRRVVPAEDIDEIVLLQGLQIPGRWSSVTTPRVLLRGGDRMLAAYTPPRFSDDRESSHPISRSGSPSICRASSDTRPIRRSAAASRGSAAGTRS